MVASLTTTPVEFVFQPLQAVRVVTGPDGEPWFIAADVCRILDIANPSVALRRIDEEDRTLVSNEGAPAAGWSVVNESGLWALVLGSRKPEAKAFKRWITSTVIPSIRKTGAYGVAKLPDLEETLLLSLELVRKNKVLELQAAADKPKVEFFDELVASKDLLKIGEVAKLLGFGPVRFMAMLRTDDVLFYRDNCNIPYQHQIEKGRFEVKETKWTDSKTGDVHVGMTTRVTQKGVDYLRRKYCPTSTIQSRN